MRFEGIVVKGKQEAGDLYNLKTANIVVDNLDLQGVFIGKVRRMVSNEIYPALICAGARDDLIEAHLHGFNRDIYGEKIEIYCDEKLRDLEEFESIEQMQDLIDKDYQDFIKKR